MSLKDHTDYLVYLFRHKYWVYRIGRFMKLGRWKLFVHDLSKLLPDEWFGYVKWKAEQTIQGGGDLQNNREFGWPWFVHTHKRNAHHWQYWQFTADSGETYPVEMPSEYCREMVADWASAGIVRFGKPDIMKYYNINHDRIKLHKNTDATVNNWLQYIDIWWERQNG